MNRHSFYIENLLEVQDKKNKQLEKEVEQLKKTICFLVENPFTIVDYYDYPEKERFDLIMERVKWFSKSKNIFE